MTSLPIIETPPKANTEPDRASGAPKGTYSFVSLGCPKNLVDSERMLGLLQLDGYKLVAEPQGTDFVVVNTCGFIEPARQESLSVIREMLELKKQGKVGSVVVAGCLAERQKDMLLDQVPEVDQIVGVFGREEIAAVVKRAADGLSEQRSLFRPAPIRAFVYAFFGSTLLEPGTLRFWIASGVLVGAVLAPLAHRGVRERLARAAGRGANAA